MSDAIPTIKTMPTARESTTGGQRITVSTVAAAQTIAAAQMVAVSMNPRRRAALNDHTQMTTKVLPSRENDACCTNNRAAGVSKNFETEHNRNRSSD